jgi:hypothetical protein
MALFDITGFKAALGTGSRPNLFELSITGTGFDDQFAKFPILCRSASLPGSTIGLIDVPVPGGRRLRLGGNRTYVEWTTTFLNDKNFNLRDAFEQWQNRIVSTDFSQSTIGDRENFGRGTPNLETTVVVKQLTGNGTEVGAGTYTLVNCWPQDISTIDLSYDTVDAIEEFTVNWSYDYYVRG